MKSLETERLLLEPLVTADAQQVFDALQDGTVRAMIPDMNPDATFEQVRDHIAKCEDEDARKISCNYKLIEKSTGTFAGSVMLVRINKGHRYAELGCWLGTPYQGKGYGTEAGLVAMKEWFENYDLNRIMACHIEGNEASAKLIRKLGMTYEGLFKKHFYHPQGRYVDAHWFGVLKNDWLAYMKTANATSHQSPTNFSS